MEHIVGSHIGRHLDHNTHCIQINML